METHAIWKTDSKTEIISQNWDKNIRQCRKRQTNHDGSGASSTTRKNSEFLLFCLDSCLAFLLAAPLHCRSLLSSRASKSLLLIISPSLDTMLSWSPDVSNSWSSLAPITSVSCLPLNLPATQKIHLPLHLGLQSGSVLETHDFRTREFVWIDQNMYKRILNAGSIYCKSKFSWSCKWENLCFLPCQEKVCQSFQFTWAKYIHKETLSEWGFTQLQQELIQTGTVCMNRSSKFDYLSDRHLS